MLRRTNIYLPEEQMRALKRLGAQRRAPVSELIREAIGVWLRARRIRLVGEDEWSKRFRSLLDRRRRVARGVRPQERDVDADVTRAVTEVRRARAARRR